MVSNSRLQERQNWGDRAFAGIRIEPGQAALFCRFLSAHDFSGHTDRAFTSDVRKFAAWFVAANAEAFSVGRVMTRDVTDFRDHLRREKHQAVSSINRCL